VNVVLFCHSALSDWNHGNAHVLRGIAVELQSRGHRVAVYEPADAWSVQGLLADHGDVALDAARRAFPSLHPVRYREPLDLDTVLHGADLVIVHEWNHHDLVRQIGEHHRRAGRYPLLFHDTHHRSVTDTDSMAAYDLRHYDGVLAFGDVIRDVYVSRGWAARAWTWHEAADTSIFHPRKNADSGPSGDVVWIGNWGDEERTAELDEFLLQPVRELGVRATVYGVRYPADAQARLAAAGITYGGWLPNTEVPAVFARHKVTVHIPRRPYLEAIPGVPTIRPFEALACGIPLVCARWRETAGLFTPGQDFVVARDGREMTALLGTLLSDARARRTLAARGLQTIAARHTCAHRVDELLAICDRIPMEAAAS